jgi:hypothetical protein
MVLKLLRLRHLFYLAVFALFFLPFSVLSQDYSFSDSKLGISLNMPEGFTVEKQPPGDVIFIARSAEDPLPTITLVKQMGNPRIAERTKAQLRNDVVDSYRAAGFFDAEAEYGEKRKLADRDVFFAKILYVHKERSVAAGVFIFPTKERYFILTMIDDRDALTAKLPILEKIAKSVRLKGGAPDPEIESNKRQVLYWFIGAIALVLSLQIGWWLLGKLKKA